MMALILASTTSEANKDNYLNLNGFIIMIFAHSDLVSIQGRKNDDTRFCVWLK